MAFYIVIAILLIVSLVLNILNKRGIIDLSRPYKSFTDEELIRKYDELSIKIATEARVGSKCQGIGSTAAVTACNNRIDSYKFTASNIAQELETRGYTIDRNALNGQAVKKTSGKASVVGRAVAGGIIAGGAGAVVGAISALDKNQKNNSSK